MQITEQIIERISRKVFNEMFSPALRQSNVVTAGSGSSVSWADNAGHANTADSASTAGHATTADSATTASSASSVPWSGVADKPAYATRWPSWTEVTSKPTSKTIWGQTYLDASSNFQNVSGALSSVTDLTMSGKLKIGNVYIEAQTDYIEIYRLNDQNEKIDASLCAYGGVSALGVGTGGGGGGGTSLQTVWAAMGIATDEQINISHLAGANGALATMTGYTTSDKNYAVQRDSSNHLYVNVPWTDHYAWSDITGKPTKLSDFTNDVVSASVSGSTLTVNVGGTDYSLTDTNTWRPVVDNLTSTDTDKSLSANQGKVLNDNFANYLPLAGGTMTGVLTLKGKQYSGNYGMNANNSDIVGLNALQFADLSDDYTESIRFPRTAVQGVVTYDTIRAADGTFYFGFASGSEFITMTGSMIKHERTDNSSVIFRAKNTNGSISLDCSTNRGVYDDTGGGWLIATNGTDTWLSRGKVGIGTTSPSCALDVNGGAGFSGDVLPNADYATTAYDLGSSDKRWKTVYANYVKLSGTAPAIHCENTNGKVALLAATDRGVYDITGDKWLIACNANNTFLMKGNVGIGTTSPGTEKLKVNGSICTTVGLYSEGYVDGLAYNTASDKRLKDIIDYDAVPHIDDIANAPAIHFTWKNKRDKEIHVGTIAQYWQKIVPECVHQSKRRFLTVNYDVIALVNTIALAREVIALKHEIAELKNKAQ